VCLRGEKRREKRDNLKEVLAGERKKEDEEYNKREGSPHCYSLSVGRIQQGKGYAERTDGQGM